MAIPLYFAANRKQFVYGPEKRWAQVGFGVYPDATLRMPQERIPEALCVIDDREVPVAAVPDELLQTLAAQCEAGCFLDFERPPLPFHAALLTALGRVSPLLVPERFLSYVPQGLAVVSCPWPCNCWERFCAANTKHHPNGWALELTPWRHRIGCPFGCTEAICFVGRALCRCQTGPEGVLYYDDRQTLLQKLSMAEQHGCRLAIGLVEELAEAGLT